MTKLEETLLELEKISAVKFGDFTLKSGIQSPVYFDLREIISYPELMVIVSKLLWDVRDKNSPVDRICGVPYTALPFATLISAQERIPMIIRRKEAKDYGTKKILEGNIREGDNCLIVEDVVTSGSSVLETAQLLRAQGLKVTDAVVLLNREQGGRETLRKHGINLHSVCDVTNLMDVLVKHKRVDIAKKEAVLSFVKSCKTNESNGAATPDMPTTSLEHRLMMTQSALTQKLMNIMIEKKSNLCVAVDVDRAEQLLILAKKLGPHICCLKTHVDAIGDWTNSAARLLRELAEEDRFLLFEDRKFADIGNTVELQYKSISTWADLVTVHGVAGKGTLDGLEKVSKLDDGLRGALVVAQMSSEGNLITPDYTSKCLALVEAPNSFAVGLISQSRLSSRPDILHLTPGVNMADSGDDLGQRYVSPRQAILERGADIIIVGRGIVAAKDCEAAALRYKEEGWNAYLERNVN